MKMKFFCSLNDVNKWRRWLQDANMDRSTVEEYRSEDAHVIMQDKSFDGAAVQDGNPKLPETDKSLKNANEDSRGGTSRLVTQNPKPQLQNRATLDLIKAQRERKNAQERIRRRNKMAAETAEQRAERLRKMREWRKQKQKKQQTNDDQYRQWALMIIEKQQIERRNRKRKHHERESDYSDSDYYFTI